MPRKGRPSSAGKKSFDGLISGWYVCCLDAIQIRSSSLVAMRFVRDLVLVSLAWLQLAQNTGGLFHIEKGEKDFSCTHLGHEISECNLCSHKWLFVLGTGRSGTFMHILPELSTCFQASKAVQVVRWKDLESFGVVRKKTQLLRVRQALPHCNRCSTCIRMYSYQVNTTGSWCPSKVKRLTSGTFKRPGVVWTIA